MRQLLGPANAATTPRNTGRSGRQTVLTRRSTRRKERVPVQGPVKKLQSDEMSHRVCVGGGGARSRLLLKEKTPRGGGGGVRGQKKLCVLCVPKIGLKFPVPLRNFIFRLRKLFLMWVGGWVGRPGLARAPSNPPHLPLGSLSNGLGKARTPS